MVSFWPWRSGDSSSPASFEKALSALAIKITDTQAQLDNAKSKSRRIRVLSTLYLGFAYAFYAVLAVLVVGYKEMGLLEWTGMAVGPLLIFSVRKTIRIFFDYRINALQTRLETCQEERAKTIQKLKDATKYDSTLQLLQKYGDPEKNKRPESEERKDNSRGGSPQPTVPARTNLPPPPTANIQRPGTPSLQRPMTPQTRPTSAAGTDSAQMLPALRLPDLPPDPMEFTPNAFLTQTAVPPVGARQFEPSTPHWYDRILDLLMGEDETSAKNRIVLICWKCRLVNGQAPPGTRRLSEVGHWRCKECGTTNGEVDEGKKIVSEVLKAGERGNKPRAKSEAETDGEGESDLVQVAKEDVEGHDKDGEQGEENGGLRKRKGKGR